MITMQIGYTGPISRPTSATVTALPMRLSANQMANCRTLGSARVSSVHCNDFGLEGGKAHHRSLERIFSRLPRLSSPSRRSEHVKAELTSRQMASPRYK